MGKTATQHSLFVRQDVGSGRPIVLLHGLFADGTQWIKIVDLLKHDYRVIVVDLLGHGRSPRPKDASYTPQEHMRALRNALESIDATNDLTLVGYSMGGAVALTYSATYPESVEQLYLISSPFYLQPDQMIAARYAASVIVTKLSAFFYRHVESLLGEHKPLEAVVRYGDSSNKFHKMIGANDNKLDATVIQKCIKELVREFDYVGTLTKVKAPTTFYAGKKDPFIVQGQLYALRQFSPYIDIQRLDIIKVDHMLVQNLPKEIVSLITRNHDQLLHIESDEGSGEVLVLLHGIESTASYWKSLVPALAEHRRVITIDLLGFGKSPKPANIGYSIAEHIAWLHRTLESLEIKQFALAGHSLGSVIALAYASTYPDQVTSLTFFSPVFLPEGMRSTDPLIRGIVGLRRAPDMHYLYEQLSRGIGSDRLRPFIPLVRSVENVINAQQPLRMAKPAKHIPTTIAYGTKDHLVDVTFATTVARQFTKHTVVAVKDRNHNFPLFAPQEALKILDPNTPHSHAPKRTSVLPPTLFSHIVKLAVPFIMVKSLAYIGYGVLLFTPYAAHALTLGVASYVIFKGYKIVRGAFSLRNEGLSYIGYLLLGGLAVALGYALYHHPKTSLTIAAYTVCVLLAVMGMARLLVAWRWTTSKHLRRMLYASGAPALMLGILGLAGSVTSVYIIIYTLAVLLILRGCLYAWYAFGSLVAAYVRGFSRY